MYADSTFGAESGVSLFIEAGFDGLENSYNATITNDATGYTFLTGDSSDFGSNLFVTSGYLVAASSNALGTPSVSSTIDVEDGASHSTWKMASPSRRPRPSSYGGQAGRRRVEVPEPLGRQHL